MSSRPPDTTVFVPDSCTRKKITIPADAGFDAEYGAGYIPAKAIPKEAAHTKSSYLIDEAWGNFKVEADISYLRTQSDFDLPGKDLLQDIGLGDLKHQNEATIAHLLRTKFRQDQKFVHVGEVSLCMGASTLEEGADHSPNALMKACRASTKSDAELVKMSTLCCGYIMTRKVLKDMDMDMKSQVLCFYGRAGGGKTEQFVASLAYALNDDGGGAGKAGEESLPLYKTSRSPSLHNFPVTPVGKAVCAGLYLLHFFTEAKSENSTSGSQTLKGAVVRYHSDGKHRQNVKEVIFHAPLINPARLKIKQPPAGSGPLAVATCPYHVITMYCCYLLLDDDATGLCASFMVKETMLKANLEKNISKNEKEQSREDFATLQSALLGCGITAVQWSEVMTTLAAIINLMAVGVVGTDSAIISGTSKGYLGAAETLLGLPEGSLIVLLTKKSNYAAKTVPGQDDTPKDDVEYLFSKMPQKSSDAKAVLEHLVFEIYTRLFESLLRMVHESQGEQTYSDNDLVLSIVDSLGTPGFGSSDDPVPYKCKEEGSEDAKVEIPISSYCSLVEAYATEIVRSQLISHVVDNKVLEYHHQGVTLDVGALPLSAVRSQRAGAAYLKTLATASSSPSVSFTEGVESHHYDIFDGNIPASLPNIVADVAFTPRGDDVATIDKLYTSCKNPALVMRNEKAGKLGFKATYFKIRHSFGSVMYDGEGICSGARASALFGVMQPGSLLLASSDKSVLRSDKSVTVSGTIAAATSSASAAGGPGKLDIAKTNTTVSKSTLQRYSLLANNMMKVRNALNALFLEAHMGKVSSAHANTSGVSFMLIIRPNFLPLTNPKWHPACVLQQSKVLLLPTLSRLAAACFPISWSMGSVYKQLRAVLPFDDSRFPIVIGHDDASVTEQMVDALINEVLGKALEEKNVSDPGLIRYPKIGKSAVYMHEPFSLLLSEVTEAALLVQNKASVMIGKNIRRRNHVRRLRSVKRAVLRLQTYRRMIVEKRSFLEFLDSCHRMMATLLMLVARARYRIMKKSINKIKPWFRLKMKRLKYIHLKLQVRSMCHLVRGSIVGKRSRAVLSHLERIQRVARRFVERTRYMHLRIACAIKITRLFRGWLCREYNNSAVAHLASSRRLRTVTRLAVKLQSLWRSLSVRLRGVHIVENVLYLQQWARARRVRRDYLDKLLVTRWLQTTARKCIAQNRVCGLMNTKLMIEGSLAIGKARDTELLYSCHCPQASLRLGSRPHAKGHSVVSTYALALTVEDGNLHDAYPEGWFRMLQHHAHRLWREHGLKKGIKMVAMGATHTIVVDDSNGLWSAGLGDGGQLGLGIRASHNTPVLMDRLTHLISEDEVMLRASGTGPGGAAGASLLGGVGASTLSVGGSFNVKQVVCGRDHTLLLTAGGRVWSWGCNIKGQLGHSHFENCATPRVVGCHHASSSLGRSPAQGPQQGGRGNSGAADNVSVGTSTYSVDSHGERKQHSVFSASSQTSSTYVPFKNIKKIACGAYHSVALTETGVLYTWGASWALGRPTVRETRPQLGVAVGATKEAALAAVTSPAALAAGKGISSSKKMSRKEQRRRKEEKRDAAKRRLTKILAQGHDCEAAPVTAFSSSCTGRMPVGDVVCGDNFVVTKMAATVRNVRTGIELYAWGNNAYGQCGVGKPKVPVRRRSSMALDGKAEEGVAEATGDKTTLVPVPARVKLPVMASDLAGAQVEPDKAALCYSEQDMANAVLSAGSKHVLLALKGDVWAWGCNRSGQIGDGTFVDCYAPRRVWKHVAGALGAQHATETTTDGGAATAEKATSPGGKGARVFDGNQVLTVKRSGHVDTTTDTRGAHLDGEVHYFVEGAFVKSVSAGTSVSVCVTYSSRNIIAATTSTPSAASSRTRVSSASGKESVAKKDAALTSRAAQAEVSSRIFMWGRCPTEPHVPLLGNSTNNTLGAVPSMKNNPRTAILGKIGVKSSATSKKVGEAAGAVAVAGAGAGSSSLEAKGLFAHVSSPASTPNNALVAEKKSLSSSPSKSKPRRASLLELTTTMDMFSSSTPAGGTADDLASIKEGSVATASRNAPPRATADKHLYLQDDGLPNITLPTEIVPPDSRTGMDEFGYRGDGELENEELGGKLKNCVDVGLVSGHGITLFTYDCEETPLDSLVMGKHHSATLGKSSASTSSLSPSAASKSTSSAVEEKSGAVPSRRIPDGGSPGKTARRRTLSPPPPPAPSTFGTSPDKYPQATAGYGSGYVISPGKRDKLGRSPSPTKRPVMPAWHDDKGKTMLEHKALSYHPDQTLINKSMRKIAISTSWVPGVMSLSERTILAKGGGNQHESEDDVSSIGSDTSRATYTTMTTDLTSYSAVRRKVGKRRIRERTMKTAELRAREKRLAPLSIVSLFAPHVARQVQRDSGATIGKNKRKKASRRGSGQSIHVGFDLDVGDKEGSQPPSETRAEGSSTEDEDEDEVSEDDDYQGSAYAFSGESDVLAELKAATALDIKKMSEGLVNREINERAGGKARAGENFGSEPSASSSFGVGALDGKALRMRRASLRQAQGLPAERRPNSDDLSDRTNADSAVIGAGNTRAGRRFRPANIPLGSSPRGRSKSPSGSPLRLAVVRDVHTMISELKEETIKTAVSDKESERG